MKKYFLLLMLAVAFNTSHSQNLAGTSWLGTKPPSPNVWFLFGADTLYYSFTGSGFTPLSVYTASAGVFAIFDMPGVSLCTDTGHYNYTIVPPHLIFTLIADNCSSRRTTLLNYTWTQLTTAVSEAPASAGIVIQQNQGEGFFSVIMPGNTAGTKELTLFDMNGKEVYRQRFEESNIRVDVGFLSSGAYLGRLVIGAGNKSFVIVR